MSKPIENCPQPDEPMRDRAYTDRQLLELAAKAFIAAGYKSGHIQSPEDAATCLCKNGKTWNPLTDDGDALRLVTLLSLAITCSNHETHVEGPRGGEEYAYEPHGDDPYAATRRAIVRAAAAIAEGAKS